MSSNGNVVATMEPYVPGSSFSEYAERFEHFFEFNQTPDDRKRSMFITLGGPAVFSELKLLYPGQSLSTLTYTEIIAKLKSRFDKIDSDVIQCYKFHTRVQALYLI